MTLDEVRTQIDTIDGQLRTLFQERMQLSEQVARVKAKTADKILKPDREAAIIAKWTGDVDGSIRKEYTAVLKRIMEVSRKYQYGRTLALTNCVPYPCEAQQVCPTGLVALAEDAEVCRAVQLPVIAVDSYAAMLRNLEENASFAGACVLGQTGMSEPLVRLLVQEGLYINHCCAVSTEERTYRVVQFSKHLVVRPEHNRVRVVWQCEDKPGGIASILTMIADYGVNLSEIVTMPDRQDENGSYWVAAELQLQPAEKESQALLFQLSAEAKCFRLLGSYEV